MVGILSHTFLSLPGLLPIGTLGLAPGCSAFPTSSHTLMVTQPHGVCAVPQTFQVIPLSELCLAVPPFRNALPRDVGLSCSLTSSTLAPHCYLISEIPPNHPFAHSPLPVASPLTLLFFIVLVTTCYIMCFFYSSTYSLPSLPPRQTINPSEQGHYLVQCCITRTTHSAWFMVSV